MSALLIALTVVSQLQAAEKGSLEAAKLIQEVGFGRHLKPPKPPMQKHLRRLTMQLAQMTTKG